MADLDATQHDYRQALDWLDLYAERRPLPSDYALKRSAWIRRVRGVGGGSQPRTARRRTVLGPPND